MGWLRFALLLVLGFAALGGPAAARQEDPSRWIDALRAVGPEGRGNEAAARAWRELARLEAGALPRLLAAMDGTGPLAANWLRSVVDTIADRALAAGGEIPAARLERFFLDRSHAPLARRLAYDWLRRVDATAPERLVPGMIDDPAPELRREAVALLVDRAGAEEAAERRAEAVAIYRRALDAALDAAQVDRIARKLHSLGVEIDIASQLGFLLRWRLVGPFDNRAGENGRPRGFARAYGPESLHDRSPESFLRSYAGKHGPVRWIDHRSRDAYGRVDLNRALVKEKGVVAYAAAAFIADRPRDVHLRLATPNAWVVWLNGERLFARDEYHHGTRLDHYRVPCRLRRGTNLILLKVCQNEQTEAYAEPWQFQLRVCDPAGKAILSADRPPAPVGAGPAPAPAGPAGRGR